MHKLNAKLSPFTPIARGQDLLRNSLLNALSISPPVINLHLLEVPGLPVQTDKTRDKEFGSFTAGFRFTEGLVEEEGIAHGTVNGAVEDVC